MKHRINRRSTLSLAITELLVAVALTFAVVVTVTVLAAYAQQSPQSVFRDASGSTIGTATKSGNTTTFRDNRGRTTGTATTDSQGSTTFRDSGGRTTGSASGPRR